MTNKDTDTRVIETKTVVSLRSDELCIGDLYDFITRARNAGASSSTRIDCSFGKTAIAGSPYLRSLSVTTEVER